MKDYYSLFVYEAQHDRWYNHFGDYDRDIVSDEMYDLNQGYEGIIMRHMAIVKTSDEQRDIDAMLSKVNGNFQ